MESDVVHNVIDLLLEDDATKLPYHTLPVVAALATHAFARPKVGRYAGLYMLHWQ